jgi:beta-glucosidase
VNGEPVFANSFLLEHLLRGAWSFAGYVVGDCDSIDEIFSEHHFTKSLAVTAALTLKRGADNECIDSYSKVHDNSDYKKYLGRLRKVVKQEDARYPFAVFLARFRLTSRSSRNVSYAQNPDTELDSCAPRSALQVSRESIALP